MPNKSIAGRNGRRHGVEQNTQSCSSVVSVRGKLCVARSENRYTLSTSGRPGKNLSLKPGRALHKPGNLIVKPNTMKAIVMKTNISTQHGITVLYGTPKMIMKNCIQLLATLLCMALGASSLHAATTYQWSNLSGGVWGTAANWSGSTIADGAGNYANFNALNITGDRTVTLDTSRTIGTIQFGDTSGNNLWTLSGSGVLTMDNTGGGVKRACPQRHAKQRGQNLNAGFHNHFRCAV